LDTADLFLEHLTLDLSDNLAENAMRPVAFKRRNWIHIVSDHAGPRVAMSRSLAGGSKSLFASYLGSDLHAELTPAALDDRN
jgi:transposase IS66 family protein